MPILNDTLTDLILLSEENRLLLDYIANNTGWNASINSASDVADNLIEIVCFFLTQTIGLNKMI